MDSGSCYFRSIGRLPDNIVSARGCPGFLSRILQREFLTEYTDYAINETGIIGNIAFALSDLLK